MENVNVDSDLLRDALDLQEYNDPPSAPQVRVLENFRAHCSDHIVSLDAQIIELEAKLANLTQIRSVWSSKADVCTKILSPIRRLPPEIVGEIFLRCLPKFRSRTPSRLKAPILLCQVCSAWREIALGLSTLWEGLTVCVNYETPDHQATVAKRIIATREWFSRAGPGTLVDYSCDIQLSEETCHEAPQILSEIPFPYTHRCRQLDMSTWNIADVDAFLYLPSDQLPHLEKVTLRFDLCETGTPTVFSHTPRLRRVSLVAFASIHPFHPLIDHMVIFPWKQLTHINIAAIQPLIWANVFRQCQALQDGTFVLQDIVADHHGTPTDFTVTTMPQLVSLTIIFYQPADRESALGLYEPPTWLFDKLVFPLLSKLSFSLEDGGKSFNAKTLPHLPLLRSLSISGNALSVDSLLSLFRASPGVVELELKSYDNVKLFNALAWKSNDEASNYLPMLENIIVQVDTSTFLPYRPFMHMVKSRCSTDSLPTSNLHKISLLVSKEWSSVFQFAETELQQHGPGLAVSLMVMPSTHWEKRRLEEYMEH